MDKRSLTSALKLSGSYHLPDDDIFIKHDGYTVGIHITDYKHESNLKKVKGYQETRVLQLDSLTVKVYVFKFPQPVKQDDIHPYQHGWGDHCSGWYTRFHTYKYPVNDIDQWINQFTKFSETVLSDIKKIELNDWTVRDNYPESINKPKTKVAHDLIVIVGDEGIGKTTLAKRMHEFDQCRIVSSLTEVGLGSYIVENLETVDIDLINKHNMGIIVITTRIKGLFDSVMGQLNRSLLTIELTDIPYIMEVPSICHEYITLP